MRIELESLVNTRDLGDIQTKNGVKIKAKKLIRSGALSHCSHHDANKLKEEYNVSAIIDFRTKSERTQRPDRIIDGVEYIINPILQDSAFGVTRENEQKQELEDKIKDMVMNHERLDGIKPMMEIYHQLAYDEYCQSQYAQFFELLLEEREGAVLWHCSAGKDRVGIATALLLTFLGVDEKTIMDDYMLTNDYVMPEAEKAGKALSAKLNNEEAGEMIKDMMLIREQYLESFFNGIKEKYGNFDTYASQILKMDANHIQRLKELYLEK